MKKNIITITGEAGSGKSSLAQFIAKALMQTGVPPQQLTIEGEDSNPADLLQSFGTRLSGMVKDMEVTVVLRTASRAVLQEASAESANPRLTAVVTELAEAGTELDEAMRTGDVQRLDLASERMDRVWKSAVNWVKLNPQEPVGEPPCDIPRAGVVMKQVAGGGPVVRLSAEEMAECKRMCESTAEIPPTIIGSMMSVPDFFDMVDRMSAVMESTGAAGQSTLPPEDTNGGQEENP
jgi:ABC-type dipeptide/oligopeptide/nickel transport system ATPase component